LAMYKRIGLLNHSDYALCQMNMASMYVDYGRFEEALRFFENARAIYTEAYGPDDMRVANAHGGMAMVYFRQERPDLAEAHAEKLYAIHSKSLSPGDTRLLQSSLLRAMIHIYLGEVYDAESLLKRALDQAETHLERDHPLRGDIHGMLVELYYRTNQVEKAQRLENRRAR